MKEWFKLLKPPGIGYPCNIPYILAKYVVLFVKEETLGLKYHLLSHFSVEIDCLEINCLLSISFSFPSNHFSHNSLIIIMLFSCSYDVCIDMPSLYKKLWCDVCLCQTIFHTNLFYMFLKEKWKNENLWQ